MMEEEPSSMISHAKLNMNEEFSDSNCSADLYHPCKHSRLEGLKEHDVQQVWGGTIQGSQYWEWFETFKEENIRTAAIKLDDINETRFHTSNFKNFLPKNEKCEMEMGKNLSSIHIDMVFSCSLEMGKNLSSIHIDMVFSCSLLFQKELTQSDVGKLNRLVIPKRYAVKHFPKIPDPSTDNDRECPMVEHEFYDWNMNLWTFRYCYWKSSQSFVFTRGWNKFVKEKELRVKDTLAFYKCGCRYGQSSGPTFLMIDVVNKLPLDDNEIELNLDVVAKNEVKKVGLIMLDHQNDFEKSTRYNELKKANIEVVDPHNEFFGMVGSSPSCGEKGFKLFGVQILE